MNETFKLPINKYTSQISEIINEKFDFIYHCNNMFAANTMARAYLRDVVDDYKDIIGSGKKLCFLFGGDKPRIFFENNRYCVRFLDIVDGCVTPRTQMLNRAWEYDEMFYWSADLPQLVAKQAHSVIRYLRSDHIDINDFQRDGNRKSFGCVERGGVRYYLTDQALHRLIYGFHTHTIKPSSFAYSERDRWFWSRPGQQIAAQNWINGIRKLQQTVPRSWMNDDVFHNGLVGCVSPPYWLEKSL